MLLTPNGLCRRPPGEDQWRKFLQCESIDSPLEEHHFLHRPPVRDPLPVIKLWPRCVVETDPVFACYQPQYEPALLLADAQWLAAAANQVLRKIIPQPAAGLADQFDVLRAEADFLGQFPIQGFLGRLIPLDATLRKLPGILAGSSAPEDLPIGVDQDNADVGSESM